MDYFNIFLSEAKIKSLYFLCLILMLFGFHHLAFSAGGGGGGGCSPSNTFGSPTTLSLNTTYSFDITGCGVNSDCTTANSNGTGYSYDICDQASSSGGFATNGDCSGTIMGPGCTVGACFGGCNGSVENTAHAQFCPTVTGTYDYTLSNIVCSGGGASLQFAIWTAAWSCDAGATICSGGTTANQTLSASLTAGTCYHIVFDGNAGAGCTFNLSITQSTLPVELLSFNAEMESGAATLTWSTASEINNDFFTIEKTLDGVLYEEVATIKGAGNSNSILNYRFIDNKPYKGTFYYRLKQTDFDGTEKSFDLVALENNNDQFIKKIYPSVVSENLTVQINAEKDEPVTLTIFNMSGKKVKRVNKTLVNGGNSISMNVADLEQGIYIISLNGNNIKQNIKFIKY